MKARLVDRLRCPACRAAMALVEEDRDGSDVRDGALVCGACGARYPIREGVPRLLPSHAIGALTVQTAETFGYGWAASPVDPATAAIRWHYVKLQETLHLSPIDGLVLDAGCGDGIDVANHALAGVEVIGVELSDGGVAQASTRSRHLPNAHVVQADLCRLPFDDDTFDAVYSYGVLHHVPHPEAAVLELARVARPNASIAVYLYEDFVERGAVLRWMLAAANALRTVTTRLSPRVLMRLCRIGSPLVYLMFAVPYKVLKRAGAARSLADAIPFRHARSPFGLAGDLFDRFGAPVEYRFTRAGAIALLDGAGLRVTAVGNDRGWMLAARKPASPRAGIMQAAPHVESRA
jgi:SAM-dependent methyltransferase